MSRGCTFYFLTIALAFPDGVALLAAESSIPDRELREAAGRILADPAFQGFERFPQGSSATSTAPAPPTGNSTTTPKDDGAPSSTPTNWWDRIRQRGQKSNGHPDGEGTASPSPEQAASPPSSPPPTSPDAPRPQRSYAEKSTPSQRGSDGITRPVRFAPKTPKPRPESTESNWDFGLGWLFSGVGHVLGHVLHLVAYAAIAAVCVLIVMLAVRAISDHWRTRSNSGEIVSATVSPLAHDHSPGETDADVFLRQALHLAEAGDYRPALGQLVLGAMSVIERRQWIRYRRGLTLNDYLRSVRSRPEQWSGLRSVVDSYEPVEFGRRTATASQFETALAGYRRAFAPGEQSV